MPVPNLNDRIGEVDAMLNKFTAKTDGDEDSFLFGCDVVFLILNSAEAEELEQLIPGAKETYIRATEKDDWKGQNKVTPQFPGLMVEIASAGSGLSLVKGIGEVESLLLRASKKAVTVTAKVKFGGQPESVAGNLCKGLRGAVSFIWEQAQQSLFVAKVATPKQNIIPKIGQIISGRDQAGISVFGQVVEINNEDGDCLVSDFGEDHQVRLADVHSAWIVNTGAEDLAAMLKSYKDRCKKRDLVPSWEAVTQATGEAFGATGTPGDGQHTLTKAIITRAVEILDLAAKAVSTTASGDSSNVVAFPEQSPADTSPEPTPKKASGRA